MEFLKHHSSRRTSFYVFIATHLLIVLMVAGLFVVLSLHIFRSIGLDWYRISPALALMVPVIASIIGYHYAKYQDRLARRYNALCRLEFDLIHITNRVCKVEHIAKAFVICKDPLLFEGEPLPAVSREVLHDLGRLEIKQTVFDIASDLDQLSRVVAFCVKNSEMANNTNVVQKMSSEIQKLCSTLLSRIENCGAQVKTFIELDRPSPTLNMPFVSSKRQANLTERHKNSIKTDLCNLREQFNNDLERLNKTVPRVEPIEK